MIAVGSTVNFPPGDTSPVSGLIAEAYSDEATAFETPSCAAIAWMEQGLALGLSRSMFAAYIEAMNRVNSSLSFVLLREDSRTVKALDVTGAST